MYISKSTVDKSLFFQLKNNFEVISTGGNLGNFEFRTPASQLSPIPATIASSGNATTLQLLARWALCAVKVVRVDLNEDRKPYNVHKYNLYCQINIYDETGSSVSYVLERVKGENERYNFKTTMLDKKFLDIYTFLFTKSETELPCY